MGASVQRQGTSWLRDQGASIQRLAHLEAGEFKRYAKSFCSFLLLTVVEGKPVDATTLLNLYSFDVMGDLAFGQDFGMLEKGEVHWAIKLLNAGMDPLALQMPHWFFRLLTAIP